MQTNQVIYIRTDGNSDIATGHIMRCLTIANACRKKGAEVVFIVSDTESEALLSSRMQEHKYSVMTLHTDYHNTEDELPLLCQLLMSYPCTALLIDSYFVNPGYLETLSRVTHVAYLDDLYAFPYPVQTIINYHLDADPQADCYRFATRKLLGPSYTPLRDMFTLCSYNVRAKINKILLTAGGMSDGHFFIRLIQSISDHYLSPSEQALDGLEIPSIHLLTGSSALCTDLSEFLKDHPNIIHHEYVTDMAEFLCEFDLVLTAAGTTLSEVCALGIPCISFIIADNQIPSAMAFAHENLVPCIGDLRTDNSYSVVLDHLLTSYADYQMRSSCSAKLMAAIDKTGADKIADALLYPRS